MLFRIGQQFAQSLDGKWCRLKSFQLLDQRALHRLVVELIDIWTLWEICVCVCVRASTSNGERNMERENRKTERIQQN